MNILQPRNGGEQKVVSSFPNLAAAAVAGILSTTAPAGAQEKQDVATNPLFSRQVSVFGGFVAPGSQKSHFDTVRGGVLTGENQWEGGLDVTARYTHSLGEIPGFDSSRFGIVGQGSYSHTKGSFDFDKNIPENEVFSRDEWRLLVGPTVSIDIPDTPFSFYTGALAGINYAHLDMKEYLAGTPTFHEKGSDISLGWEAFAGAQFRTNERISFILEGFIRDNPKERMKLGDSGAFHNNARDTEGGVRAGIAIEF